ncbi:MAG: nickel pincer cofactor biosynthesis protein LarC [Candidatus Omnitrophica bacterium]|nr:nickel pincer cofactor biosynthesis protein LarC [Candidatus Omnitrophota bacterium]
MKIAYFDCFSGISGDMTVAAFLDAGLKTAFLKKKLALLNIGGYKIGVFKDSRNGLSGTRFIVNINASRKRPLTYREIKKIITRSRLSQEIKSTAAAIFERLAAAESRIHNQTVRHAHFHEIGDLDSLIDIVSAAIACHELDIKEFFCLNLKAGKGSVLSSHGRLPLPAPAALEILKGKPVSFIDAEYELITPTGAAILTTLVKDFNKRPDIDIERIGYGAGSLEIEGNPNLLRLITGTTAEGGLNEDEVVVLETNIDDMNPVYYEYLIEKLFKTGALDVYLTGIYAKKTRPAILLTVLAREELSDGLARVIMKETTSSGVRYYKARRKILRRAIKAAHTRFGPVNVKINFGPGGIKTISPEYEDCKRIAEKTGLPIKRIFHEASLKINLK